jgi:hypothetical protein
MPQPNDLSRSLVALDQNSTIIAVVELSHSSWLVGGVVPGLCHGNGRAIRRGVRTDQVSRCRDGF